MHPSESLPRTNARHATELTVVVSVIIQKVSVIILKVSVIVQKVSVIVRKEPVFTQANELSH